MKAVAVVMDEPEKVALRTLELSEPRAGDVVVEIDWSGISTGTEKLLYTGRMPHFPGMGYPLVPGYESVGRVIQAGAQANLKEGDRVFVPGAACFGPVRGLFGGAAERLVVPAGRALPIGDGLREEGVLLALAATARHALAGGALPDLIVGHGVLGRLLARLAVAAGAQPTIWETNRARRGGARGYAVVDPSEDTRRDYRSIIDVSGDAEILDGLIERLAPGGEIVLAGFYATRLSFAFAGAFMREARLRVAAQWRVEDLTAVRDMCLKGSVALDGLITHRRRADDVAEVYRTAFTDPDCLKMIIDWRFSA